MRQILESEDKLVVITESFAVKHDLSIGDIVAIGTGDRQHSSIDYRVDAIVKSFASEKGYVLTSKKNFNELFPHDGCHVMRIYSNTQDLNKLNQSFSTSFPDFFQAMRIETTSRLRQVVLQRFDQTFELTFVMTMITLILGLFGLCIQLAHSLRERRLEWHILSRAGASRRKIIKLLTLDHTIILICGTGMGLFGGYVLGWILTEVINLQSFGWSLTFAPSSQMENILGPILAVFAVMLIVTTSLGYFIVENRLDQGVYRE